MTSEKIFNTEKLEDASLENIHGGLRMSKSDVGLVLFGGIAAPVGILGGTACSIASAVYSSKAHSSLRTGDTKNAKKYAKKAKKLTIATATLSSLVPVGLTALWTPSLRALSHEFN